jgi:uncharacterized protein (UPF0303 family)
LQEYLVENKWWIYREASNTMNKLLDVTIALHEGRLSRLTSDQGFVGVLLFSGLPQVEDHLLGVEVLTEYLTRKGELL